MSQDIIRKNAGISWARRRLMNFSEPTFISALYGMVYTLLVMAGVLSLIFMPPQFEHIGGGQLLMSLIAACLIVGGAGGMIAVSLGANWVEFYTIILSALGLISYFWVTAYIGLIISTPKIMYLVALILSIILVLLRYYWVWDKSFRTGSRSDRARLRRDARRGG